jgi:hypothetical protein
MNGNSTNNARNDLFLFCIPIYTWYRVAARGARFPLFFNDIREKSATAEQRLVRHGFLSFMALATGNGDGERQPPRPAERPTGIFSKHAPGQIFIALPAHSGTTLLASEILKRRCYTIDTDPVFCEISIRRLENYRKTGRLGWQNSHAFENDIQVQFEPLQDGTDDVEPQPLPPNDLLRAAREAYNRQQA